MEEPVVVKHELFKILLYVLELYKNQQALMTQKFAQKGLVP